jgi:type I restriction enzyme S subunit
MPEGTPNDYPIKYVEISDVDEQLGITGWTEYPFASAPSRARRVLKDGDVLISTVRTYLRAIAPVTEPPDGLVGSTGFAVIRPVPYIYHSALLGYVIRAEWFISSIISRSTGVSYPAINASDLVALSLPVPPWKDQQTIATFLDHETAKIDTLIHEQKRLIELLKEKRQAVISHAVTKGLNPDVPMKDSGVEWLGEVPTHWIVSQLKFNTLEMQTGPFGSQLHAEDYVEGGIPLINPAHMIEGLIFPDPQVSVDEATWLRLKRHSLAAGDIILARRGELGRCAIISEEQDGWLCGTGSLKAKLTSRIDPEYAYLLISSKGVVSELSLESKGSTMQNLNTETLGRVKLPIPPLWEQKKILNYIHEVSGQYASLISTAQSANKLISERRSALISAAVTGKIDIRDWQPPMVESAFNKEVRQAGLEAEA